MALPRVADSLAGQPSAWIDALFAAQVGEALEERVLTGGYPEALHRSSERRRQAWAHSYLNAILQRDVREIAGTFKAAGVVSPAEGDQCHIEQAYPEGMRKAKDVPYISHLIAVSALAWEDARRIPACGAASTQDWMAPPGNCTACTRSSGSGWRTAGRWSCWANRCAKLEPILWSLPRAIRSAMG